MAKGMIRKIDGAGRVVIPIETRRAANLTNREYLNLSLESGTMKLSKGQGRRLDELGRYTIPKEIRRIHKLDVGQAMDIYFEGEEICIQKYGCEWCDETENLIDIDGHKLCPTCAGKVSEAYKIWQEARE